MAVISDSLEAKQKITGADNETELRKREKFLSHKQIFSEFLSKNE